ncbi:MAG: ribosome-associated heat shock protein Hsp15 [Candidatus Binatota bacterium]|nr:ribosome-associated heat shock protein Hsp15 [Candidatus Binatota bacterium]
MSSGDGVRLDRWLWAARFYKTRSLAAEAVSGGHVHVNGGRGKPARTLRPGDLVTVRRGPHEIEVRVGALAEKRGPASAAALLYVESEASRRRREELAERLRADAAARPFSSGRPSKRDRRDLRRLRQP